MLEKTVGRISTIDNLDSLQNRAVLNHLRVVFTWTPLKVQLDYAFLIVFYFFLVVVKTIEFE